MTNIRDAIRKMAADGRKTVNVICVVDSVDKDNRTIDCTPLDEGAPLLKVNLQANQGSDFGVVLFPRVDSFVVVGFVADGDAGVVLLMDDIESIEVVVGKDSTKMTIDEDGIQAEVGDNVSLTIDKDTIAAKNGDSISMEMSGDKVTFNGGNKNGFPLSQSIVERLNLIEQDINTLKSVFSTWVTVPQDGGAALKTASVAWAGQSLQTTKLADIANDQIEQ